MADEYCHTQDHGTRFGYAQVSQQIKTHNPTRRIGRRVLSVLPIPRPGLTVAPRATSSWISCARGHPGGLAPGPTAGRRHLIDQLRAARPRHRISIPARKHDTTSPGGRLVFHIFASLAEFERDIITERTNAGLAAARARGRVGGATITDRRQTGHRQNSTTNKT